jgi:hypothetical protein
MALTSTDVVNEDDGFGALVNLNVAYPGGAHRIVKPLSGHLRLTRNDLDAINATELELRGKCSKQATPDPPALQIPIDTEIEYLRLWEHCGAAIASIA